MGIARYLEERPSKQFLAVIIAFAAGIGLHSLQPFNTLGGGRIFLFAAILGLTPLVFGWKRLAIRIPALIFLAAILGFLRFDYFADASATGSIAWWNGASAVRLEGEIVAPPQIRESYQRVVVQVRTADRGSAQGRLLMRAPLEPRYAYGDFLKINCQIERPGVIRGFDQARALLGERVFSECGRPLSVVRSGNSGNQALAAVYGLKDLMVGSINSHIPEPQASLAAGLLFGDRRLPSEETAAFQATGISHIVAVSGYNVAIITVLFFSLLALLPVPRRLTVALTLALLAVLVAATGASASVARAAIMGSLPFLAQAVGRPSGTANALFFAAAAMLLVNPALLFFDLGFVLSFAASAGLIWLGPALADRFGWARKSGVHLWDKLCEMFVQTLSAIAMTFPIILATFGKISLVAPAANLLVIFAVPWAMLFSFLAAAGGIVWSPLGRAFSFPATILLSYIEKTADLLSRFPAAQFFTGRISWVAAMLFYAALLLPFFLPRFRRRLSPAPSSSPGIEGWIISEEKDL